jgi:hypothetical protein
MQPVMHAPLRIELLSLFVIVLHGSNDVVARRVAGPLQVRKKLGPAGALAQSVFTALARGQIRLQLLEGFPQDSSILPIRFDAARA